MTDGDRDFTFTTTSESGVTITYYVDVDTTNEYVENAITAVRNGADTASLATNVNAWFDFQDAVDHAVHLTNDHSYQAMELKYDTTTINGSDGKAVYFTLSSEPTVDEFDAATGVTVTVASGTTSEITINQMDADTIVVVRLQSSQNEGAYVYVAFSVDNHNS